MRDVMPKIERVLVAIISFVVGDIVAWELLGAISWPSSYSFMRPLILAALVVAEIFALWAILSDKGS